MRAGYHARLIADAAADRRRREAIERAANELDRGADPGRVLSDLRAEADKAAGAVAPATVSPVEMLAAVEAAADGLDCNLITGWKALDEDLIPGGIPPGSFGILAAGPGVGKTQLLCNMPFSGSVRGRPVRALMLSLEMSDRMLSEKLLSISSGVSQGITRRALAGMENAADYADALSAGRETLADLPLRIVAQGPLTLEQVEGAILRHAAEVDVVLLDYLQLVQVDADSRRDTVEAVTTALLRMARQTGATILAISSPSRTGYHENARPTLATLRESGALEFSADLVLSLWREQSGASFEQLEVEALKNRFGAIGTAALEIDLPTGRISDLPGVGMVG